MRENILITDKPGSYRVDTSVLDYHDAFDGRFSKKMTDALGEPRRSDDEPFTDRHEKIAASA